MASAAVDGQSAPANKGRAGRPKKPAASEVPKPPKVPREKKQTAPKAKSSHPPTAQMVGDAIKSLDEKGGSSLKAIKKFIADKYKVDVEKLAPFIRKYLKAAVGNGKLVQVKGTGATGSFKLLPVKAKAKKPKTAKQPGSPKKTSPKKTKPTSPKKGAEQKNPKKTAPVPVAVPPKANPRSAPKIRTATVKLPKVKGTAVVVKK